MKLPRSISPLTQEIKRTDPRTYDALNRLNKNLPNIIKTSIEPLGLAKTLQIPNISYQGYYRDGDLLRIPDGFSAKDVLFFLVHVSTLSPKLPFTPGQKSLTFPADLQSNLGVGSLLASPYYYYIEHYPVLKVHVANLYSGSGEVKEGLIAAYAVALTGTNIGIQ